MLCPHLALFESLLVETNQWTQSRERTGGEGREKKMGEKGGRDEKKHCLLTMLTFMCYIYWCFKTNNKKSGNSALMFQITSTQ